MPTTWRVLDRIDTQHLGGAVRVARAAARARARAVGAGPDLDAALMLDFDATITIAHSEKENADTTSGRWTWRWRHRRLRAGLRGPCGGVLLRVPRRRPYPAHRRPHPLLVCTPPCRPRVAAARPCVRGPGFSEATSMIDLGSWPEGSRLILRKERPHPGAQLTFPDADGLRVGAILTDTARASGRAGTWHAGGFSHRHARVEDRIREAKATALRQPAGPKMPPRTPRGRRSSSPPSTSWPGPTRSAPPTPPRWPAARSPRSATASCTSPPGSPAAPGRSGCASTRPGAGPPTSPKASTDSAPRSPDHPRPRSPEPQHPETRRPAAPAGLPARPCQPHTEETGKPDARCMAVTQQREEAEASSEDTGWKRLGLRPARDRDCARIHSPDCSRNRYCS